jgi:hypothetical protein
MSYKNMRFSVSLKKFPLEGGTVPGANSLPCLKSESEGFFSLRGIKHELDHFKLDCSMPGQTRTSQSPESVRGCYVMRGSARFTGGDGAARHPSQDNARRPAAPIFRF